MTAITLYSIALTALIISFANDKEKTKKSLLKAKNVFLKILPDIFAIMFFVGITLAILEPTTISKIIGAESGILGITISLITGSATLIPSFVAFPLGATLLNGGAGYPQVAAFVSTLMAVGIITLPMEIKYFNKTTALIRNGIALIISIIFTIIIGLVMPL